MNVCIYYRKQRCFIVSHWQPTLPWPPPSIKRNEKAEAWRLIRRPHARASAFGQPCPGTEQHFLRPAAHARERDIGNQYQLFLAWRQPRRCSSNQLILGGHPRFRTSGLVCCACLEEMWTHSAVTDCSFFEGGGGWLITIRSMYDNVCRFVNLSLLHKGDLWWKGFK